MNNEQYNQIIDEAYENYKTKTEIMMGHGFHGTLLSKEEFINKIKTDPEFSEKWGLKIEERELSLEERKVLYQNELGGGFVVENNVWLESKLKTRNIPSKLITVTYNNKTAESYE